MTPLEEIESLLASEAEKWNAGGFHPNKINGIFTQELFFIVAMKLDALITYLDEQNIIIDREGFDVHYKKMLFTKLRDIRHKLEADKIKGGESPVAVPSRVILGPDGQPMKL